ncbi:MAG: hypothetical protein FJ271_05025 [Planctomycetes bacterium]|nr:hypothetical protein [Planctomycetota bacterium]
MNSMPDNAGVLVQLPLELHYVIEPVLRYECRSESDVFAVLDSATSQVLNHLAHIAERVLTNDHYPMVNQFLDKYEINDHDECTKLYFFFGLLDHAGLSFD